MKTLMLIFAIGVTYTLIADEISFGESILLSVVCLLAIVGISALKVR